MLHEITEFEISELISENEIQKIKNEPHNFNDLFNADFGTLMQVHINLTDEYIKNKIVSKILFIMDIIKTGQIISYQRSTLINQLLSLPWKFMYDTSLSWILMEDETSIEEERNSKLVNNKTRLQKAFDAYIHETNEKIEKITERECNIIIEKIKNKYNIQEDSDYVRLMGKYSLNEMVIYDYVSKKLRIYFTPRLERSDRDYLLAYTRDTLVRNILNIKLNLDNLSELRCRKLSDLLKKKRELKVYLIVLELTIGKIRSNRSNVRGISILALEYQVELIKIENEIKSILKNETHIEFLKKYEYCIDKFNGYFVNKPKRLN